MVNINWKELFPTKASILIFVLYIGLFVNQGILVTASQKSNRYEYDIVTTVLLTEVLKLITSVSLYCRDRTLKSLFQDTLKNKKVLGLYFVPAFLYCLYNNLSFINLAVFDPTTYYLLLQFRVVITAVLFQVIFKKKLSKQQWLSLLILTIGCMFKQINFTELIQTKDVDGLQQAKSASFFLDINAVFILVQATCSCLAGVYNEYLLKEPGANVHIFTQNVFMYLDSIVCNAVLLLLQGNVQAFSVDSLSKIFHYKVVLVMLNNTAIGIITSFFLKSMNSILKTFASAMELIFTAILCYLLFDIPIYVNTIISIGTVLFAIYLYSQNPVSNPPVNKCNQNIREEEEELLMEEV